MVWLQAHEPTLALRIAQKAGELPLVAEPGHSGLTLPLSVGEDVASVLPPHRLPQSIQSAAPRRRAAFIAGSICAELALAALSPPVNSSVLVRNSRGGPLWPRGVLGSITHNWQTAAAVAARQEACVGLGIDVETRVDSSGLQAITDTCLTSGERDQHLSSADPAATATLVFSAKESLYKALQATMPGWVDYTDVEVDAIAMQSLRLSPRSGTLVAAHLRESVTAEWRWHDNDVYTRVVLMGKSLQPRVSRLMQKS
ncbi:4'-phosphopantetheinyl transferase family protein [Thauera sp. Sel9]|uniref:4'-phosphopantetheinyl transferase family protein n=1 Tax=Thauera sp. Sel9 TaxID=2974299 RepID=UPI0021E14147|nr:4'-phosphopantetheinyl transferase superfamily protein [Thauera sp. Sel9]